LLQVCRIALKCHEAPGERREASVDELKMGTLIGLFVTILIALLIAAHYRRERMRRRLLHRMDHHHWWDVMRHRH
jgi:hypothetical protein